MAALTRQRAAGFAAWLVAAFLLLPGLALAERHALVIGNSGYERNPLINPVNDATDMAARLGELGYQIHGEGPLLDLTLRQMQREIRSFTRGLEPGDLAVFYFAGHGVEYKGANYLIPSDDSFIEFQEDLPEAAYPVRRLVERMAGTRATGVLILDACRNNPLPSNAGERDTGVGLEATPIPAGASTMIMYAAAPGQTAGDSDGARNGLFTGALLEALENPYRPIDRIMQETSFNVRRETDGHQVPWIGGAVAARVPPPFAENPDASPDPLMSETWARVVAIEDPWLRQSAVGAFLETFPNSPHEEEAQALLSQVSSPQGSISPVASGAKPGSGIQAEGEPLYGALDLSLPISEAGSRHPLLAGGFEAAEQLGGVCHGQIAASPDYVLDWDEGHGPFRLSVESEADTVLISYSPDGRWLCSAPGRVRPVLTMNEPSEGRYSIWVGTVAESGTAPEAELLVSAYISAPVVMQQNAPAPDPEVAEGEEMRLETE